VGEVINILLFEIVDSYPRVRNIQDDDISFSGHGEDIENIGVGLLEENFSFLSEMDEALLLSRLLDSNHDVGVVDCGGEAENLLDFVLQGEKL
jgi:hypothetical protein